MADTNTRLFLLKLVETRKARQKAGKKLKGNTKAKQDNSAKLERGTVDPNCGTKSPEEVAKQTFYITTAINYTNGAPHAGHAYEAITSDIIARYHRVFGRDVFFLTGSDEHGQKVEQSALKAGVTPQKIADKYSDGFKALNKRLSISNDFYIRTTMPHHYELAQKMWKKVRDNGDIYLKDYVGWYNIHEEQYVTDKEAEENDFKDEHGRPLEKKSEESYFFRMSKYQDALIKHITEVNPGFIQPETRKKEMLAFLSEPLQDLCISRTVCQWGVPCPEDPDYKGDKSHVMYVWFDALTNYLSGIHYLSDDEKSKSTSRFWPANVHIIGKDIVRFHTIIWPTMLMSAGVPLPKTVFGHGFVVASDGKKMSKTLGNVVDPQQMLNIYPSDSFRFYIARTSPYGQDLPFSESTLCSMHNSTLKDGLGNLLHRVTSLCKNYNESKIPDVAPHMVDGKPPFDLKALKTTFEVCFSEQPDKVELPDGFTADATLEQVRKNGYGFQIHEAGDALAEAIKALNGYLQIVEPWKIKGKDEESMKTKCSMVRTVLEGVYIIAHFLEPFSPACVQEVFHKIGVKPTKIPCLKEDFQNLPPGTLTYVGPVLFEELVPGKGVVRDEKEGAAADAGDKQKKKNKQGNNGKNKDAKKNKKQSKKQDEASSADVDPSDVNPFTEMCFKVGKIVKAWHHPDSEKLFCEQIDVGEESLRNIASGLRDHYKTEDLEGRLVVVVANLKSRKFKGFESHGMVVCATSSDKSTVKFLEPPAGCEIGTRLGLEGKNPDAVPPTAPNRVQRKKVLEAVLPDLKTNSEGVACWKGTPIHAAGAPCVVPGMPDSSLS